MKPINTYSLVSIKIITFDHLYSIYIAKVFAKIALELPKINVSANKWWFWKSNTLIFSFQKRPIFKKMGISTGFYWFFLSFTVHTLRNDYPKWDFTTQNFAYYSKVLRKNGQILSPYAHYFTSNDGQSDCPLVQKE